VEDKPPVQDKEIGHGNTEMAAAREQKVTDEDHKEAQLPSRDDNIYFAKHLEDGEVHSQTYRHPRAELK